MIRKFNFTGRNKIPRKCTGVTLLNADKHPYSFDIEVDLSDFNLPKGALVYVEAYTRSSYMRFDYGTVGDFRIPACRELKDIEAGTTPLFRVKIVDKSSQYGRIIAIADKLHPEGIENTNKRNVSLLHVEFSEDLEGQVWKLDLTEDWPVIQVNNQISSIKEIAKSDDAFTALVYPDVVRQILNNIIEKDELDPKIDEEDWPSYWVKFVSSLPGVGSPPTGGHSNIANEQSYWIENAVRGFCNEKHLLERYKKLYAEEQDK